MSDAQITAGRTITGPQHRYIEALQGRLKMSSALLEAHCKARWGRRRTQLEVGQASALIEEMKGWLETGLPAQLLREAGQQDLPGMEESNAAAADAR